MEALGIDSSNYRSSAALYRENGHYVSERKLLAVEAGKCGLRQSDAVFAQTRQLPTVLESVLQQANHIHCVGVSDRPRPLAESYMPCFLVGTGLARAVSGALKVPCYCFSHQEGHLAAALISANRCDLLKGNFLAFHVSGGTTEVLKVGPKNGGFSIKKIGGGLDLHAGQLVDRVGVMLGLEFPSGNALEQLARTGTPDPGVKICVTGCNCNLSGMQNYCTRLLQQNTAAADIAATLFHFLGRTLLQMAQNALKNDPLPLIFAGGVMANRQIRQMLAAALPANFASPELSGDNAVGLAYLAQQKFLQG